MSAMRVHSLTNLLKCTNFTQKTLIRCVSGFVPRRSFLYMPGNDEKKIKKAAGLNADCAVLDCEDAVAFNRKDEARNTVHKVLGSLSFGRTEVCVRVNSVSSGLAEEDLHAALSANILPQTIVVPKVDTVEDLKWISDKIGTLMKGSKHKIGLITQAESAISLLNLRDVCTYGTHEDRPFILQAVIFGSDDFLVSIGGTRTKDAKELLFARQYVVVHAKAFGLQAIDLVDIDFKDLEGLKVQSEEGARMGFTGKQIIHPGQIDIVNKAFTPPEEKIQWAKELLAVFEQHEKEGKGAMSFQGDMIDMPLVLQARAIVRLSDVLQS